MLTSIVHDVFVCEKFEDSNTNISGVIDIHMTKRTNISAIFIT